MSDKINPTNNKKYIEAVAFRDWQTCDLICDEHTALVNQIQKLKQQLEVYRESDKILSDTLESRENDILKLKKQLEKYRQENQLLIETNCELLSGEHVKRLQQQLESMTKQSLIFREQRDIESKSKDNYKQQLAEAVEVIEKCRRHNYLGGDAFLERITMEFIAKYRGEK